MFLVNVNSSMLAIIMDIIITVNVITSYISIGLSMLIKIYDSDFWMSIIFVILSPMLFTKRKKIMFYD